MATRIKVNEIKAGDFMRLHIFPVRNYHKGTRKKHFAPSSAAQEKYNAKMAALRFADLLHTNFTENDFAIRLSYDGIDVDLSAALRSLDNWIRRMRYAYNKCGVELRAMWKTEQGKNGGRIHHHVVINACEGVTDNQRYMRNIWKNGGFGGASFVYIAPLEFDTDSNGGFNDGGLVGLAKYFIFDNEDGKQKLTAQRYGRTRNLKEPVITERTGAITTAEAAYLASTKDFQRLADMYADYTVCAVVPETYSEESEHARFCTGLFCTVYLRKKVMRYNCTKKVRRKRPNDHTEISGNKKARQFDTRT